MPYKRIITTQQVRRNLLGLQDELDACDPDEVEDLLVESLDAAQAEFEMDLQIWLYSRMIMTYPQAGTDVLGVDYDLQEPAYDYYTSTYGRSGSFSLRHRPVTSVQRMAVELNPSQILFIYPPEWIRVNPWMGQVSIYPASLLGTSVALRIGNVFYLPYAGGFFTGVSPLLVSIDYTAGIPDADTNPDWAQLRVRLAQAAGLYARDAIMERIVVSAGREGISTAFANGQQQAAVLAEKIEAWKQKFIDTHNPIKIRIV